MKVLESKWRIRMHCSICGDFVTDWLLLKGPFVASFVILDPPLLLDSFRDLSLRDSVVTWFSSYLSNHILRVYRMERSSLALLLPIGAPQHSVLDLLLFSLVTPYPRGISSNPGPY